jgi:hypothetical protein
VNATCNSCAFTCAVQGQNSPAVAHENDYPGHRVSVWDSPTSQAPRTWWTSATD